MIPRTFELGTKIPYSPQLFAKDVFAGVIVGVVALPLAMAFSISAGGSPAQGLYTAIIAGFFISFLGGSRYQIGGPTGAFVVIIYGVIARHGMSGLIVATILAGVMLVAMGLSKLGKLIKYIPYPVTTGFTTGIGILIFSQQLKDFFGLTIERSSPEFFEQWAGYISNAHTANPEALGIALLTAAIILVMRRFVKRIPGAIVGVVAATVLTHFAALPIETIGSKFGGIPSTLPLPVVPQLSWAMVRDVFPDAFTIAMLAAIESLLSAVVADGMTGDKHDSNMELTAQGIGNIMSGIFGGIPATGAIARTAANIKNGSVSPISGIIHTVTLTLFILFLSPLASSIPLASLAAVLIVVSWDMSNIPKFIDIAHYSPKSDTLVLVVTFLLTIVVDLTFAVQAGMVIALILFMRRVISVTEIKAQNYDLLTELVYSDTMERKTVAGIKALSKRDIEVFEITGPFFFGVADMLQTTLLRLEQKPHTVVLRMRNMTSIDSTGITALDSFYTACKKQNIRMVLYEICTQPKKALEHSRLIKKIGTENVFEDIPIQELFTALGSENSLE
ncbi:MAG: sulfate permease [Treponemataceae bacterium]|nr:MAG: sulfate permease [Treponemataceae bacterium]